MGIHGVKCNHGARASLSDSNVLSGRQTEMTPGLLERVSQANIWALFQEEGKSGRKQSIILLHERLPA